MRKGWKVLALLLVAVVVCSGAVFAAPLKIAMVVKGMGNPFFDACRDGGNEAAQSPAMSKSSTRALPRRPLTARSKSSTPSSHRS